MTIDYDKIRRLVALVEQNHLTELAVEEDGLNITIKAERAGTTSPAVPVPSGTPAMYEIDEVVEYAVDEPEEAAEVNANLVEIISPMVGVFYRRPSPDSPAFCEEGDEVQVGQTIGLIEAMKVFSEVPAEVGGTIVELPIDNGKLVQQGDVLAVIDVSAAGLTVGE